LRIRRERNIDFSPCYLKFVVCLFDWKFPFHKKGIKRGEITSQEIRGGFVNVDKLILRNFIYMEITEEYRLEGALGGEEVS
jgi:hypothetical protein